MALLDLLRDYSDIVRILEQLRATIPRIPPGRGNVSAQQQRSLHMPVIDAAEREMMRLKAEIERVQQPPEGGPISGTPDVSGRNPMSGL